MADIAFPAHETCQTHATIRNAFGSPSSPTIASSRNDMGCTNISDVTSAIIRETGRWVEGYLSDALFGIRHIESLCCSTYPMKDDDGYVKEIDEIITFGLRRNGVDHGNYVMSRLMEGVNRWNPYLLVDRAGYRKVLAARIHVWIPENERRPVVECELKDITHGFSGGPDPADLNNQEDISSGVRMAPFENGNPVPQKDRSEGRSPSWKSDSFKVDRLDSSSMFQADAGEDAIACSHVTGLISKDGYTDYEDICRIWMTKSGRFITDWRKNEYRSNPHVASIINHEKADMKEAMTSLHGEDADMQSLITELDELLLSSDWQSAVGLSARGAMLLYHSMQDKHKFLSAFTAFSGYNFKDFVQASINRIKDMGS